MELGKLGVLLLNRVLITLFLLFIVLITGLLICPLLISGFKGWHRNYYGVPDGVYLGNVDISRYYLYEVEDLLFKQAEKLVCWPRSAKIDSHGLIKREVSGQILDVSATLALVKKAKAGERVEIILADLFPNITAQEILQLNNGLGIFQTFIEGTKERLHNIKLAGSLINFTLLMPGEIFSFNEIVGQPTAARGFQEANIIVGDDLVLGYGGGICQVSSTLYNAVLAANLTIKERNTHSQEVNYVPAGQDAAVAYDYFDFRFLNSKNYPLLIRVWVFDRNLQIGLYGPRI